ncbi:MAG: PLDc N-terminal domain-containing protein [Cyclobacteriaceae bacterium]|nr:PLDc N-terminal domain-containing protein [Cyclobacteriaceae bacterium]
MELLTPGFGLIIFQALILVPIVLFLVAVFMLLMNSKIDPTKKIIWLVGITLVPVLGPILLFMSYRKLSNA